MRTEIPMKPTRQSDDGERVKADVRGRVQMYAGRGLRGLLLRQDDDKSWRVIVMAAPDVLDEIRKLLPTELLGVKIAVVSSGVAKFE